MVAAIWKTKGRFLGEWRVKSFIHTAGTLLWAELCLSKIYILKPKPGVLQNVTERGNHEAEVVCLGPDLRRLMSL